MKKILFKSNQSFIRQNDGGFTLIETIIYIALFGIIIGGGMVAAYQIIESANAAYNHVILQEEANFLFRKINWALTGATSVSMPSPNTLVVSKPEFYLTFTSDGNNITLKRGSNPAIVLNSGSISPLNLLFEYIPPFAGKLDGVITNFTLETAQNGRKATQEFSFTRYLRTSGS